MQAPELNESSSLEINQPQHQIVFSHTASGIEGQLSQNDELSYSKDEQSLSFQIEEENKIQEVQKKEEVKIQPPRKKRKEIFQKYKRQQTNEIVSQSSETISANEDILQTFDQIFKFNPSQRIHSTSEAKPSIFSKNKKRVSEESISPQKPVQKQIQSSQPFKKKVTETQQKPVELKKEESEQKKQMQYSPLLKKNLLEPEITANDLESNRISLIENREGYSMSGDAEELANILQSEIFKQKTPERKKEANEEEAKTDHYEKIDMSSSIASSIMMKQSRFTVSSPRNGRNIKNSEALGFFGNEQPRINPFIFQGNETSEEKKYPIFLRYLKKINSSYPNTFHPSFDFKKQNEKLQQIIYILKQVLNFLENITKKINEAEENKNKILQLLSDKLTVYKFLNCPWNFEELNFLITNLRSHQNFIGRPWSEQKVKMALSNYKKIAQHYEGVKINLLKEKGREKYFEIRKKFWDIEKNIFMISQDMEYKLTQFSFPLHFYEYYHELKEENNEMSSEKIQKKRILLQKIYMLQKKHEQLSCSVVGLYLIQKIEKQVKFMSPF